MKQYQERFDVIVVGGGHAGIEASLASARMGCTTALVTMDPRAIGRMSCNPAIGGTAKGHLVREIDALGGEMGKLADKTGIHFKMLNKSKGPAVWSPRCQNDREMYSREAQTTVLSQDRLSVIAGTLRDLIVAEGRVIGIEVHPQGVIRCQALVLCSGTFLSAIMHTGLNSTVGGRYGEPSAEGVTDRLLRLGFIKGRLKTGTPPRISLKSIDLASTEMQLPDEPPTPFSHDGEGITNRQIPMYLTYTNQRTHDELRKGFDDSPMFSGRIKAVGPRYCPSIEDKINRFADRDRHQIFLEPEGYETDVVYMNGFSTSLPGDIQERAIRTIPGLERSVVLRLGYAVEYDFFPPHQLEHTLETKILKGLFFAGQINGTSGYEEAAAQGIMAGINAVLSVRAQPPLVINRDTGYIGVLIDDLINKGTEEPYRIFTSRAEYRLKLRQDNADSRLMRRGFEVGLRDEAAIRKLGDREQRMIRLRHLIEQVRPPAATTNALLERKGAPSVEEPVSIGQLIRRNELSIIEIIQAIPGGEQIELRSLLSDPVVGERVCIEVRYEGYLKRQDEQIERFRKQEELAIPSDFDFLSVHALSAEGREKLDRIRPRSVGQATRISGVTPADIAVLMVYLRN